MSNKLQLNKKYFLLYKLFNSSFTGLSVGIVFIIYKPLEPIVYSIGGIALSIFSLFLATFYDRLLNIINFFIISMIVETLMILTLITFLFLKISFISAIIIYCIYQITFIFGGYLVRAETLVAKEKNYLGRIDVSKNTGYLIGLGMSLLSYQVMEFFYKIDDSEKQIEVLHYPLFFLQLIIVSLLILSFNRKVS